MAHKTSNLPLPCGWLRTWQMCHWPWSVKSTIRKSKASPTQSWIALGKLVAIYNFAASLFCTEQYLFRIILDPASWQLSQSCDSCEAALTVEICWAQIGQFWHLANTTSTLAPSRTGARVAPKRSKFTSARWLASNLTAVPLFIKCQINNQKSRASPTQTWTALGKLVAMKDFAASLFCTAQYLFRITSDPASC